VTTAAHVPSDVETYLARVRAALSDVPAEERDEVKVPHIATPPLPAPKPKR